MTPNGKRDCRCLYLASYNCYFSVKLVRCTRRNLLSSPWKFQDKVFLEDILKFEAKKFKILSFRRLGQESKIVFLDNLILANPFENTSTHSNELFCCSFCAVLSLSTISSAFFNNKQKCCTSIIWGSSA